MSKTVSQLNFQGRSGFGEEADDAQVRAEKEVKKRGSGMVSASCPIAQCQAGAKLLGIKRPDGRVMLMPGASIIDDAFVKQAEEIGKPEERMRFASPCVKGDCQHWEDDRCSAIDGMMERLGAASPRPNEVLAPCPIRDRCRWFDQSGSDACHVCETVFVEQTEKVIPNNGFRGPKVYQ